MTANQKHNPQFCQPRKIVPSQSSAFWVQKWRIMQFNSHTFSFVHTDLWIKIQSQVRLIMLHQRTAWYRFVSTSISGNIQLLIGHCENFQKDQNSSRCRSSLSDISNLESHGPGLLIGPSGDASEIMIDRFERRCFSFWKVYARGRLCFPLLAVLAAISLGNGCCSFPLLAATFCG